MTDAPLGPDDHELPGDEEPEGGTADPEPGDPGEPGGTTAET
jgi:hypothetical protein